MPIRFEASNSLPQDVLTHCIAPSTAHGILFAGAARLFTAIDPISAGVTGLIMPITDYVLEKITPNLLENNAPNQALTYVITRLGGYAAATAAANALGYSISFGKILALSACTNALMVGVGIIVFLVAKRIFSSVENFDNRFLEASITAGIPLIAVVSVLINDGIDTCCRSEAQQGGQGAEEAQQGGQGAEEAQQGGQGAEEAQQGGQGAEEAEF